MHIITICCGYSVAHGRTPTLWRIKKTHIRTGEDLTILEPIEAIAEIVYAELIESAEYENSRCRRHPDN